MKMAVNLITGFSNEDCLFWHPLHCRRCAAVTHSGRVPHRAGGHQARQAEGRSGTPQPPPVKIVDRKVYNSLLQPEVNLHRRECRPDPAAQPDLFVVVAYGEILKKNILDIPKYRLDQPPRLPSYLNIGAPRLSSGQSSTGRRRPASQSSASSRRWMPAQF